VNIAIVSPVEIFPINSGAPNRIFNLAKTISDMGQNVYLIFNSKTVEAKKLDNLNLLSFPFPHVRFIGTIAKNLNVAKALSKIDGKLDIIQCEFPSLFLGAYFAKKLRGNPSLVLDEHGVEINFVQEVYFKKPGILRKAVVVLSEFAAVKLSTHIFTCSRVDSEHISRIYKVPASKITDIPNAVGAEFLSEVEPHKFEKPTILFLGGFRHSPNLYGARAIKDVIMPLVIQKGKDAQFVFIGQEPPSWLSNTENIKVLGYVPDVRPFIKGAHVCIAPIFQGSGTRLKILEYMALGKPVVTTSKGAEGIEAQPNIDIIIEDDMQRFSARIVELLRDTTKAERLGLNARKLIEESYTWEKVTQRAIEVYHRLQRSRKVLAGN